MTIIQMMKSIVLLLTVLVNVVDIIEAESHSSVYVNHKAPYYLHEKQNTAQLRSRYQSISRKYDQTNPSHQHHGHNYNNTQEALLTEIVSLLLNIKLILASQKQHLPYQPIYVPYFYPVLYSVPQYINSYDDNTFKKIDAPKNSPIGGHNYDKVDDKDDNDFLKPISSHYVTEIPSSSNESHQSEDENVIMKSIVLILTVLVNVVEISEAGRHSSVYVNHKARSNLHDKQNTAQLRSRHQLMSPKYDQKNPSHQYQGHNDNPQEAFLTEIVSLLHDIKLSLASQKQYSPYQPVYVPYPYPVAYLVPQYINSFDDSTFKKIDDTKNSSIVVHNYKKVEDKDNNDVSKPISSHYVTEIPSSSNESRREDENVVHFSKPSAVLAKDKVNQPSTCEAAILACCKYSQSQDQEKCFLMYNCSKTYATKLACKKEIIDTVVQKFVEAEAPIET